MQQGVITIKSPAGLTTRKQTLADVLRRNGYKTHLVGK